MFDRLTIILGEAKKEVKKIEEKDTLGNYIYDVTIFY